jgi:hypothetical protein
MERRVMPGVFNYDNRAKLLQVFSPLFHDLPNPKKRPKLAHYTSIMSLECILRTQQIWYSNPLFMNDFEELRFGLQEGARLFWNNEEIRKACGTQERFAKLASSFSYFAEMKEHDLDTYVLCFSEHNDTNNDGLLSMWRGYGGNGSGAALVIDTKNLGNLPTSPLLFSKVEYYSTEIRLQLLENKLNQFAELLSPLHVLDDFLWIAASIIFERIMLFALTTKHHGFHEENEWRFIYFKERDTNRKLWPMFDYAIGKRGLEPKLKLKLEHIDGVTTVDYALDKILDQIILGPMNSFHTVKSTFLRMLELMGRQELRHKVIVSGIPFRDL